MEFLILAFLVFMALRERSRRKKRKAERRRHKEQSTIYQMHKTYKGAKKIYHASERFNKQKKRL